MADTLATIRSRAVRWCVVACIYHTILAIGAILAMALVNAPDILPDPQAVTTSQLWSNSALLGLIGSLLYFSRKAYVYLITDKIGRLHSDAIAIGTSGSAADDPLLIVSAKLSGYLLYLYVRPLAGVVIGPLLVMTVLAGLSTLGHGGLSASAISPTGVVLVLVLSFIAGYKSSDMFDHFSKMGANLIRKSEA